MTSFSFKKIINFSAILFFAFSLFLSLPLFTEKSSNAQAQQNCDSFASGSNEQINCIADQNSPNYDVVPQKPSVMAESECNLIKDRGSNEYLNCIADLNDATYAYNAYVYDKEVAQKAKGGGTASCSGLEDFFKSPIACTARGLGYAVLTLLTYFVALAGQIFDFSAKFSILGMGTLIGSANNGINIAWSTIRDLGNIIFIFMLLWISIMNILQMGDAKKFIPTLIIAALLINFSLFFTKVIIDTSNIVAVQFYSSITNGGTTGISEAFMQKFDAETMLSGKESSGTAWGVTAQMWSTAIMVFIMFFIFLQASFLFIARTAVLIFLLPFSPIMFLGSILPRLKEYTDKWWKELICNSLSAPIYFLLIWVSLQILSSVAVVKSGKGISDALSGLSGYGLAGYESAGIIFNYLLVCVFLIASYKTAKCDGISGTIAGGLMATAGLVAGGMGGAVLRNSVGRIAQVASSSERLKNWSEKSIVGKGAFGTAKYLQGANFDVRDAGSLASKIPLVGGLSATMVKKAGLNLDMGKATGDGGRKKAYEDAVKKQKESRLGEAKSLEATKIDKLPTIPTIKVDLNASQEEQARVQKLNTAINLQNAERESRNAEISKENKARSDAEAERLAKFNQRVGAGSYLDKTLDFVTGVNDTRSRGSTQAINERLKEGSKKKDWQSQFDNITKKLKELKTSTGLHGEASNAELIEKLEENEKEANKEYEMALSPLSGSTPEKINRAEKAVSIAEKKLAKAQNYVRDSDRIGEQLGKKPGESAKKEGGETAK